MAKLNLLVLTVVLATCYGNNELWKRNENIIKRYDTLYENLALTTEDASNKQKRAFSIILTSNFKYIASGGDTSIQAVSEGPADVIASFSRTALDVIISVLDPAISLVKEACRPENSKAECESAIQAAVEKEESKCSGFTQHMWFRKKSEELFNNEEYVELIEDILKFTQNADDDDSVKYYEKLRDGKIYKAANQKLLLWYKDYISGNFLCNLPPVDCNDNGSSGGSTGKDKEKNKKGHKKGKKDKYKKHN